MHTLKKSLDDLIEALEKSDVYKRYKDACTQVRMYPEKEKRLQEFRKKNYLVQNSKDAIDVYVEAERLEKEYADIYRDPLLLEFLAAEVAVCRFVQHVNRELISCLDFEPVLVDD